MVGQNDRQAERGRGDKVVYPKSPFDLKKSYDTTAS